MTAPRLTPGLASPTLCAEGCSLAAARCAGSRPGVRGRRREARGVSPPPFPGSRAPGVAVGLASACGARSRLRWAGGGSAAGRLPGWAPCTASGTRTASGLLRDEQRGRGQRVCFQNSRVDLAASAPPPGLGGREMGKREGETLCSLGPRVPGLQGRCGRRTGPASTQRWPRGAHAARGAVCDLPWSPGSTGSVPGISQGLLPCLPWVGVQTVHTVQ